MKNLFNILLYRFLFERSAARLVFWLCFPLVWTYFLAMDIIRWRRPWPWGKAMLVRQEVLRKFRP